MILSNDQIKSRVAVGNLIENFVSDLKQDSPEAPFYGLHSHAYTMRLSNQFIFWKFINPETPRVLPAGIDQNSPAFAQHMQSLQAQANMLEPCVEVPFKHCLAQELEEVVLTPQGFIFGITMESFNMPNNLCGHISIAPEASFVGLSMASMLLQPQYAGPLTLRIANVGPKMVKLRSGTPIATVSFHDCTLAGTPL